MNKTTLDLSTLSDIPDGTHIVKVKAKAEEYNHSEFSNEVSYTKAPATYSGKFTTYTASERPWRATVTVTYNGNEYKLNPSAEYEVLEQQLNIKAGDTFSWEVSGANKISVINSKNCTVTSQYNKYGFAKPAGDNWQLSTSISI